MDEKRIKLGVDAGDVDNAMKRLSASTQDMFKQMVAGSRSYSTSAREVIGDLENQIRLLEKRNKLEAESRRFNIEYKRGKGELTGEAYRSAVAQSVRIETEGNIQANLLRELIETIRQQARSEIRENRSNVEREIQNSKTVNILNPNGDPISVLKQTVQQYELGKAGQEEIKQRGFFDASRRGLPYLSTITGSSSIYEAGAGVAQTGFGRVGQMGGMLGFLGGLGVIGAMAAGRAIQASLPYEQAMGKVSGISGAAMSTYEGFGREYSAYGYTMDEALNRRYAITRARGSLKGAGQSTLDALLLERGLSLDSGLIDQLESLQRGEKSGFSTRGIVQGAIGSFKMAGDTSLLPEYLQILAQLGHEQIKLLGRVDSGINTKMIEGIRSLSKSFDNPEYLAGIINSVRQGLISAPNAQTEALQFAVLSRMNPKMGIGELFAEREKGQYAPEMFKMLGTISGGSADMMQFLMASMFPGISQTTARRMAMGDMGEMERVMKSQFSTVGGVNLEGRAGGATGILIESMANWSNTFISTGEGIIKSFEEFTSGFKEATREMLKSITQSRKNQQDAANALLKMSETQEGLAKGLLKMMANQADMSTWRAFMH